MNPEIREENVPFPGKLKIFSGPANPQLTKEIADCLNLPIGKVRLGRHADKEFDLEYEESIRGTDTFIIQPTNQPDNHLFELFSMIRTARDASAGRITAVIPYYGYARSDRKALPRTPINAKLVADLITKAGANRILAVDFHAAQIQGFFDIPVDHLFAKPVFINKLAEFYKEEIKKGELIIVAPDGGATNNARAYAKRLGNALLTIIDKRRPEPNKNEVLTIIGMEKIPGKTALEVDDLVDTGGTLAKGAVALMEAGAKRVDAACVHPVFSEPFFKNMTESVISNFFVSNTIEIPPEKITDKIKIISIAPLIAEAIREIHNNGSVSQLF